MSTARILIVDDEPPARLRLRQLLDRRTDVTWAGSCATGTEAIEAIRHRRPDIVLLDVHMPACDGFGVVEAIGPASMPPVIFATAFDHHAVRAFDVAAVDYLVKPIDGARFDAALDRALESLHHRRLDGLCDQLHTLLAHRTDADAPPALSPPAVSPPAVSPEDPDERLVIRSTGRVIWVEPAEIDWVEGAGSYARLHLGSRSHLLRDTLGRLEARLAPHGFVRIHRSTLVNSRRVVELRPRDHGESSVFLHDGTSLKLSRSYRDRLDQLLRGPSA